MDDKERGEVLVDDRRKELLEVGRGLRLDSESDGMVKVAVCGLTGVAPALWPLISSYLFCFPPSDAAMLNTPFRAKYLDSGRHYYTHSWQTLGAPRVTPIRTFADRTCVGRVGMEFVPICQHTSFYVVELEDEGDPRRPVDNPSTIKFRYKLPIDGFGICRELEVHLDAVFGGPKGLSVRRVRDHEISEIIYFHGRPLVSILRNSGVARAEKLEKNRWYRGHIPCRWMPDAKPKRAHIYAAKVLVRRDKIKTTRQLAAILASVTIIFDTLNCDGDFAYDADARDYPDIVW